MGKDCCCSRKSAAQWCNEKGINIKTTTTVKSRFVRQWLKIAVKTKLCLLAKRYGLLLFEVQNVRLLSAYDYRIKALRNFYDVKIDDLAFMQRVGKTFHKRIIVVYITMTVYKEMQLLMIMLWFTILQEFMTMQKLMLYNKN